MLFHKNKIFFVVLALLFTISFPAFAAGPVDIETSPRYPEPNAPITFRIKTFAFDINTSYIVWQVDGMKVDEGTGLTEYKTTTGPLGKEMLVEALILTEDKKSFKEELRFRPAIVDLLWQANTYVPPFYKGKALPTHRSTVHAVAIPEFGTNESLSASRYSWTLNISNRIGEGTGVAAADFESTWKGMSVYLDVETTSADKLARSGKTISILSVPPELLFYENSPLFGVRYDKALRREVAVGGGEYSLRAAPFYFYLPDVDRNNIVYEWTLDYAPVHFSEKFNRDITLLGAPDGGSRNIILKLFNNKRPTQSVTDSLVVNFTPAN